MSAVGIAAPKRPSWLLEKGFYITAPQRLPLSGKSPGLLAPEGHFRLLFNTPTQSLSQPDSGSNGTFGLPLLFNQIPPSGLSFPAEEGKVPPTGYCRGGHRLQTEHTCIHKDKINENLGIWWLCYAVAFTGTSSQPNGRFWTTF